MMLYVKCLSRLQQQKSFLSGFFHLVSTGACRPQLYDNAPVNILQETIPRTHSIVGTLDFCQYILSYYWQETRWRQQPSPPPKNKGNGQKREYRVLFWPKTNVPENNSGRECCWPYLIGQHPLSPVFGQKRPCTPGNSYFAQISPVFGHFMFLSGGLLDCLNRSTVR